MSSQQALNDLFAFLDQLELQEKLEQQSITTGGDTATEYSSLVQTEQSPISILNSAVILESPSQIRGPGVIANAYDNSVGSVATRDYSAPVLQDSEGRPEESPPETKENQIFDSECVRLKTDLQRSCEFTIVLISAPLTMTTPPRRKAVQFNPITPLRTPHRRAPKFVFTPLKPSQSAAQLEPQVFSTIPLKGTIEVTVPTLDCGSIQLQPPPLGFVETSQDRPVEDSDEAVTPTSNIPSNSPFAVEDLLGNDDESIMSDSTSSPILHPSLPVARAKKRVIYSSDDDSDTGNSMVLAPRTISAAEEPGSDEIEFLGEKALQIDNNRGPTSGGEVPARNSTNRQTGRREVSKFIDDMARAVGKNDDEDSSDDGRDLDGFIVDDDYVEYEDDTAEEKSEGGDYVLSYSPTKPRLKRAPSKRLQVDLTETSDEDTPASPAAVLPPRPKPRARQTSAKSLETVQKIRSEKRAWNENKEKLAQAIMDDLDSLVFEGKLVKQWNVRAVWNNKLLTTAGRAHHKRFVREIASETLPLISTLELHPGSKCPKEDTDMKGE
ncbi:hypothetical protein QFC19_005360 [Naganishia cerealis]|uniref:Uncharacterized protein n=1 Tax=Naganishia cerealis TaxID=610337 RepID=A0ACC2VPL1_9TREE|nr:hypothetical protein QFC19_005360 [Naganishia cerealis]